MEEPNEELNPQQQAQAVLKQAWFLIRRDWALKFKAVQEQRIKACIEDFRGIAGIFGANRLKEEKERSVISPAPCCEPHGWRGGLLIWWRLRMLDGCLILSRSDLNGI